MCVLTASNSESKGGLLFDVVITTQETPTMKIDGKDTQLKKGDFASVHLKDSTISFKRDPSKIFRFNDGDDKRTIKSGEASDPMDTPMSLCQALNVIMLVAEVAGLNGVEIVTQTESLLTVRLI